MGAARPSESPRWTDNGSVPYSQRPKRREIPPLLSADALIHPGPDDPEATARGTEQGVRARRSRAVWIQDGELVPGRRLRRAAIVGTADSTTVHIDKNNVFSPEALAELMRKASREEDIV